MTDFRLSSPSPHDPTSLAYWPTPEWVTRALLETDAPTSLIVIEPSAGEGSIARVLRQSGRIVYGVEVRPECAPALVKVCSAVDIRDWLAVDLSTIPDCALNHGRFAIVGNPPYAPASVMLAHVKKCVESGAEYVALLLPVNFLCSQERRAFNVAHPVAGYYPLARRPSCSEDGAVGLRDLAWHVWRSGAQRIEVIG